MDFFKAVILHSFINNSFYEIVKNYLNSLKIGKIQTEQYQLGGYVLDQLTVIIN